METQTENAKIKISFGNKKLPETTAIFNIPAEKTCPLATEFCKSKCYAKKAERLYKNVLQSRERNFLITRRADFAELMAGTIKYYDGFRKIRAFRIHESGDFYNQNYLAAWYKIAAAFPGIVFYAYTKSFHLNFENKPANFVLIASFDQSTNNFSRLMYETKKGFFNNTFSIIGRNEAGADCVQDCTVCDKCITGRGLDIKVNLH